MKLKYMKVKMKKFKEINKELELLFNEYKKMFKEVENNFSMFIDNNNKKINFMIEIINFYKVKKMKVILIIK